MYAPRAWEGSQIQLFRSRTCGLTSHLGWHPAHRSPAVRTNSDRGGCHANSQTDAENTTHLCASFANEDGLDHNLLHLHDQPVTVVIDVSPTPATQLTTHIVRFAEVVEQVRGRQQVDGGDTLVLPHAASHAVEEGLCTCRGTQATHITATTVRGWVVMIAVDAEHWHADVVIGVTVVDTFTAVNAFDAFFIHHLKRDAPRAHAVAPEDFDDSVQGPLGRFVVMEQIAAKQHEIHLVTPPLSPECGQVLQRHEHNGGTCTVPAVSWPQ